MQTKQQKREEESLIFGLRPIIEAITSGKQIEKLFIQNGLRNDLSGELLGLCRKHAVVYQFVPIEKLNRLTSKNHQGAAAFISSIEYYRIQDVLPTIFEKGKVPLLLLLDRITDVRNFGAIARTAECSGVDAIIIPSKGAAQINGDAIKTSAGALHKIPVCREDNLKEVIEYLKESGLQIISCTEKTEQNYFELDYTKPTVIIMGSEEDGISGEYLKRSDAKAKIPLFGEISSLNVSVASGVILFEAAKQRLK